MTTTMMRMIFDLHSSFDIRNEVRSQDLVPALPSRVQRTCSFPTRGRSPFFWLLLSQSIHILQPMSSSSKKYSLSPDHWLTFRLCGKKTPFISPWYCHYLIQFPHHGGLNHHNISTKCLNTKCISHTVSYIPLASTSSNMLHGDLTIS